jgi:hypothetical protein
MVMNISTQTLVVQKCEWQPVVLAKDLVVHPFLSFLCFRIFWVPTALTENTKMTSSQRAHRKHQS